MSPVAREALQDLVDDWRRHAYQRGGDSAPGMLEAANDLEDLLCRMDYQGIKDTHLGVGVKMEDPQPGRTQTAAHIEARAEKLRGGKRKDNKSGVPGIHRHGQTGTWRVQVQRVSGGCYEKFEDAVTARNELAVRLYRPEAKQYRIDGSLISN